MKISYWLIFLLVSLSAAIYLYLEINQFESMVKEKYFSETISIEFQDPKPISFLFLGDMMLDRYIRDQAEATSYDFLFDCIDDFIQKHDYAVANLEGTVTDFESVSQGAEFMSPASFRFTFDPKSLKAAKKSGIDIFGLANNHIHDFGEEGIRQTVKSLEKENLLYFGNPLDKDKDLNLTIFDKGLVKGISLDGIEINFVAFNQFFGSFKDTISKIKNIDQKNDNSIIIVYAHWGDEYTEATPQVISWAHNFIDSGADMIIGHHPHVIQKSENYKGRKIYYSLGNFIFDQYWEESVRTGLAVSADIKTDGSIDYEEQLLKIKKDGQTCLVE